MKALVVTLREVGATEVNAYVKTYPPDCRVSVDGDVLVIDYPRQSEYVNPDWVCYNLKVVHHWGIEEVEG